MPCVSSNNNTQKKADIKDVPVYGQVSNLTSTEPKKYDKEEKAYMVLKIGII